MYLSLYLTPPPSTSTKLPQNHVNLWTRRDLTLQKMNARKSKQFVKIVHAVIWKRIEIETFRLWNSVSLGWLLQMKCPSKKVLETLFYARAYNIFHSSPSRHFIVHQKEPSFVYAGTLWRSFIRLCKIKVKVDVWWGGVFWKTLYKSVDTQNRAHCSVGRVTLKCIHFKTWVTFYPLHLVIPNVLYQFTLLC